MSLEKGESQDSAISGLFLLLLLLSKYPVIMELSMALDLTL